MDSLTKDLSEKYFTRYLRYLDSTKANEKIQITVVGFADPRPINGRYIENEIKFLDLSGNEVTVKTNDSLDNFKLSGLRAVSYTHLRAHETVLDLVCRLLLEKKKKNNHICSHSVFIIICQRRQSNKLLD